MILTHLPAAFRKSARSARFHLPNLVFNPPGTQRKSGEIFGNKP